MASTGHACCLCVTPSEEDANGTLVPSGPVDPSEWSHYSCKICDAAAAYKLLQPSRKRKACRLLDLAGKTFLQDNIKMEIEEDEEEYNGSEVSGKRVHDENASESQAKRRKYDTDDSDDEDEGAGPSKEYELKQMGFSCWFQNKTDDGIKSKFLLFFFHLCE